MDTPDKAGTRTSPDRGPLTWDTHSDTSHKLTLWQVWGQAQTPSLRTLPYHLTWPSQTTNRSLCNNIQTIRIMSHVVALARSRGRLLGPKCNLIIINTTTQKHPYPHQNCHRIIANQIHPCPSSQAEEFHKHHSHHNTTTFLL